MPALHPGQERVAFLIYPGFTALDMVGPHHMLNALRGEPVRLVAASMDPVTSDSGMTFLPQCDFRSCPADLDVLCVPGGTQGTLAAMGDAPTLDFLRDRGARAGIVSSVCTGSLILGAAGLLRGYRATSHWLTVEHLARFGAIPTQGRVVHDRNRVTGGGVTAGIDFGLTLLAGLRDPAYAQATQLVSEYAPAPPFDAGTPDRAPPELVARMRTLFAPFLASLDSLTSQPRSE
jgi:putative intracellular protease/amidase